MKTRGSVPALFVIGALIILIVGVLNSYLSKAATLDVQLHDTYIVVAHNYVTVLLVLAFVSLAGINKVFSLVTKRQLNRLMSYIHFFGTLGFALLIILPIHDNRIAGMPRRYYDYYSPWASLRQFISLNSLISFAVIVAMASQLIFIVNLIVSAFVGRRIAH